MAQPISTQQEIVATTEPPGRVGLAVAWVGAVAGAIVLLAALVLWFQYGTAVFFEMIASGISACF